MRIDKKSFGALPDGTPVSLYTLTNSKGMVVDITDFGGILVSIKVPDRNGKLDDVNLGFDTLEDYLKPGPFFGALVGRHANRIEASEFTLNGKTYKLCANDGRNHLHGGETGFDKVLWKSEIVTEGEVEALKLTYFSPDGEENYPGNLVVTVVYSLNEDNTLKLDYTAVSDKDTVVNLTNHAYFNLGGHASGNVLNHELTLKADFFTPVSPECIPTGEVLSVAGTPMDFNTPKALKDGLVDKASDPQIQNGQGYDHNWVLKAGGDFTYESARVYEPVSGRVMTMYTTKPGVQLYTGNFVDTHGKGGVKYDKWAGLCLETQYFPNAMKHTHFPSPVLKAGEFYRHTTSYRFDTL